MSNESFGKGRWIITQANYLRMLAPFISTEETRYYLNGIYVEPAKKGIYLVATNGRQMGVIYDAGGTAKGPFINRVSKSALATAKKAGDVLAVFSGGTLHFVDQKHGRVVRGPKSVATYSSTSERLLPIDGHYPDWKRIMPGEIKRRLRPLSFNPKLVADFAKVAEAAGLQLTGFNFHQTGGPADPVVVRTPSVPEFFGLLMPMRVGEVEPLPALLPKRPKEKAQPVRKAA